MPKEIDSKQTHLVWKPEPTWPVPEIKTESTPHVFGGGLAGWGLGAKNSAVCSDRAHAKQRLRIPMPERPFPAGSDHALQTLHHFPIDCGELHGTRSAWGLEPQGNLSAARRLTADGGQHFLWLPEPPPLRSLTWRPEQRPRSRDPGQRTADSGQWKARGLWRQRRRNGIHIPSECQGGIQAEPPSSQASLSTSPPRSVPGSLVTPK